MSHQAKLYAVVALLAGAVVVWFVAGSLAQVGAQQPPTQPSASAPAGGIAPCAVGAGAPVVGTVAASAAQPVHLPLIGETAPAFEAVTTQGPIHFPDDFKGRWIILFSHPADFTPVCTTEFMTFATMLPQFHELNCELVGLSVDSNSSHIAWLRTIQERIQFKDMKNVQVTFPLVADVTMDIARHYGMIQPSASNTQAVRAVFFIDPQAKVRAVIYYPMANGRNFQEILRLLIAMQTTDTHKVSTPADWQPGDDVIVPPPASCGAATARVQEAQAQGYTCVDWFLCLKKLPKSELKLPSVAAAQPARQP